MNYYTEPTYSGFYGVRAGHNPNREARTHVEPAPVVAAMVVHLPDGGSGYHAGRIKIVRYALDSMIENAGAPCKFVIWANGCADDVNDELFRYAGRATVILGPNIGKMNAVREIYQMHPGKLVSISDDDILHYPGWLDTQLVTYRAFDMCDQMGVLSGVTTSYQCQPESYPAGMGVPGEMPREYDMQHGASIGRHEAGIAADLHNYCPRVVARSGSRAWLGAGHSQFLGLSDRLLPFMHESDRLMGQWRKFDLEVHEAGWLRLMTYERTCRHMGNRLTEADREEAERVVGSVQPVNGM